MINGVTHAFINFFQVEEENYSNGIYLFGKSLKSILSHKNMSVFTAKLMDEFEEATYRPEFVIRCQFHRLALQFKEKVSFF